MVDHQSCCAAGEDLEVIAVVTRQQCMFRKVTTKLAAPSSSMALCMCATLQFLLIDTRTIKALSVDHPSPYCRCGGSVLLGVHH